MVVKMKKWSPWQHLPPPPVTGSKKFRVKVERIKLEGFEHGGGGGEKVMGVELSICLFSLAASGGDEFGQRNFVPWILTFKLTYGEYIKGKMTKIGKVSLDLAEFASKIESPVIEKKLPIDLVVAGLTTQATISVLLSFVEIRDSGEIVSESTQLEGIQAVRTKKKQLSLEEVSLSLLSVNVFRFFRSTQ
ncbi:hypothetical protein L1987_86935 [Smallanthus sonchifolius]|uniref:Uncharacterized protein n=1 Tax=Smallanthus sonchifolius TaxID=185202 RepID=A0ACB8Y0N1_9ASTR|nr:hypothetical protein L1987_86935 [Smallanthus sonchifolius]